MSLLKNLWARTKSVFASIKNFFVAKAKQVDAWADRLRAKKAKMAAYGPSYDVAGFFLTAATVFIGLMLVGPKLQMLVLANPTLSAVIGIGLFVLLIAVFCLNARYYAPRDPDTVVVP